MTLLNIKPSTKDVDLIVPVEAEFKYLTNILKDLGYKPVTGSGWKKQDEAYVFDLFAGKRIHTTDLLDSPLDEGRHTVLKEFSRLYIGILNDDDLITSKLFRGAAVDFEDCLMLVKVREGKLDIKRLEEHYKETASYDISQDRILGHWGSFLNLLKKEGLYHG